MTMIKKAIVVILALAFVIAAMLPAEAASKKKIDRRVNDALAEFHDVVHNADSVLKRAEGVLVFPIITKGGLGIGYEGGNGALQIDGKTVQYYRLDSPSIGLQLGVQQRRQILVFLSKEALDKFRNSSRFEIGVDGSVTLVTLDAGGEVSSETFNKPVVGFVFGAKGLMYNISLEGAKIHEISPK